MNAWTPPAADEAAPFYAGYLARVGEATVRAALEASGRERLDRLMRLSDAELGLAYAPGKWTEGQVWRHVLDTEAVFRYRLLALARDPDAPQPGYDQDRWAATAPAPSAVAELLRDAALERQLTLATLDGLAALDGRTRGSADGLPITLRALAAVVAGHDRHHLDILRIRYPEPGAGQPGTHRARPR